MYDIIIAIVLRHEGGYVNDPDDLGGETNYGITKRNYPNLDIKNLTRKQAIEIYKNDFWIPLEMDKFTNPNLALQFFDMAVNAGKTNAKKLMLQALEIKKTSTKSLLSIFKQLRIDYYNKVATYRNNKKYLAGWLNRVNSSVA